MPSYDNRSLFTKVEQWAKNNKWIVGLMMAFAVVTALSTFFSSLDDLWSRLPTEEGDVVASATVHHENVLIDSDRIQDASLHMPRQLVPPVLDIKVVNNTKQTKFLEKIRVRATLTHPPEPQSMETIVVCASAEPTGFYDINLDLRSENQSKEILISHALMAEEFDRFLVSIAPNPNEFDIAIFRLFIVIESVDGTKTNIDPVDIKLEKTDSCTYAEKREFETLLPTSEVVEVPPLETSTSTNSFTEKNSLDLGSSGASVRYLQQALTEIRIYTGPITGYYGQLTKSAVSRFQQLNGIEPTGVADPVTVDLIYRINVSE